MSNEDQNEEQEGVDIDALAEAVVNRIEGQGGEGDEQQVEQDPEVGEPAEGDTDPDAETDEPAEVLTGDDSEDKAPTLTRGGNARTEAWKDSQGTVLNKHDVVSVGDGDDQKLFYVRGFNTRPRDREPMANIGFEPYMPPEGVDLKPLADETLIQLNGRGVKTINVPSNTVTLVEPFGKKQQDS